MGTESTELSQRTLDLVGRARLAGQVADRTLWPADPLSGGRGEAIACGLYREAVYWALLAQRERGAEGAQASHSATGTSSELLALWDASDSALLSRAAGGAAAAQSLRAELAARSFVEFAELAPGQQRELAQRSSAFCKSLLQPFDAWEIQLERAWTVRLIRFVSAVVALALCVVLVREWRLWHDRRQDLAPHATWTTSSTYPEGGCKSPEQHCAGSPNYFFHTLNEQEPWIVFDLGELKTLSAVWVENRVDCCHERAVPLVVSVSVDNKNWKQVARSDSPFETWSERFTRVPARWVKLSGPQQIPLHLAGVRLVP